MTVTFAVGWDRDFRVFSKRWGISIFTTISINVPVPQSWLSPEKSPLFPVHRMVGDVTAGGLVQHPQTHWMSMVNSYRFHRVHRFSKNSERVWIDKSWSPFDPLEIASSTGNRSGVLLHQGGWKGLANTLTRGCRGPRSELVTNNTDAANMRTRV